MKKTFYGLLLTLLFATTYAVSAQASSGTGQVPMRGEGAAAISGYTISNLRYYLSDDPVLIDTVEFDLDAPAHQVVVSFDSPSSRSFSCSNTSRTHWSCELDRVLTEEVNEIHISASE